VPAFCKFDDAGDHQWVLLHQALEHGFYFQAKNKPNHTKNGLPGGAGPLLAAKCF